MLRRSLQVFGAIVSFAMTLANGTAAAAEDAVATAAHPVLEDRYPERRGQAFAGGVSASRI